MIVTQQWKTHVPKFDGDAPEGVSLETHDIEHLAKVGGWIRCEHAIWLEHIKYRYRPRSLVITPDQWPLVQAYGRENGVEVPDLPEKLSFEEAMQKELQDTTHEESVGFKWGVRFVRDFIKNGGEI